MGGERRQIPTSALMDPTAAVRASAFKSLGALSQHDWAFSPLDMTFREARRSKGTNGVNLATSGVNLAGIGISGLNAGTNGVSGANASGHEVSWILSAASSLVYGLSDTVLSVRISASWALGGLCESLGTRWSKVREGAREEAKDGAREGAGLHPLSTLDQPRPHASTSASEGNDIPSVQYVSNGDEMPRELIEKAAEGCLLAMQDVDKVRSNGVRGLGVLLSFIRDNPPSSSSSSDPGAALRGKEGMAPPSSSCPPSRPSPLTLTTLLDKSLQGLQSCLTTGSMKVQWSACLAAQGLLTNPELHTSEATCLEGSDGSVGRLPVSPALPIHLGTRITPLLLVLVMLVRDCGNFKIRTHAAAALAASSSRGVYGEVYPDAVIVVLGAIDSTTQELATTEAGSSDPTWPGDSSGAAPGSRPFPNYRYVAGLSSQLRSTLLHLISLASPSDASRLKDPVLVKKSEALIRAFAIEAEERLTWKEGPLEGPLGPSDMHPGKNMSLGEGEIEGGAASPRLPLDPFEEGRFDTQPLPLETSTAVPSRIKAISIGYSQAASKASLSDRKEVADLVKSLRGLERLMQGAQVVPKSIASKGASSGGSEAGLGLKALIELVSIACIIDPSQSQK